MHVTQARASGVTSFGDTCVRFTAVQDESGYDSAAESKEEKK